MKPTRRDIWFWAGLAAVLLFDVWVRGHAFGPDVRRVFGVDPYLTTSAESEPLDCDEAIYGYIGDRLASGRVMYRDVTENKPPGGYWLFAAAVRLGGLRELTVRLMPLPFVLVTVVLLGLIGRRLAGHVCGLVATFVFALTSTDPFLYGESANMEHMINAFSTASLALLIAAWDRPGRGWLVASGVLLGASCLVKQTSAVLLPLYGFALVVRTRTHSGSAHPAGWGGTPRSGRPRVSRGVPPQPPGNDRGPDNKHDPRAKRTDEAATTAGLRWRHVADTAALAAGCLVVLAAAAAVLAWQGGLWAGFDDVVRYGRALATDTPAPPNAPPWFVRVVTGNAAPDGRLPWPFGTTNYLVWWGTGTWPFWLASVPAVVWMAFGRGRDGPRRFVGGWTVTAWVQVGLPGLFWAHYYLLPLPGASLCVAVALTHFFGSAVWDRRNRVRSAIVATLILAAVAATVRLQWVEYLNVPPEQLVRDRGGPQWLVNRALGREIGRRAAVWKHPSLFVWGWQGPLYFYSGYDNVTRMVFVDDFLKAFAASTHPLVRPRIERTMRALRATPPSLIFTGYPPFPELKQFLDEAYIPSRLAPGLWVERSRYGAFEAFARP